MIPSRNYRHARESGHPRRPALRLRPWAPASAGATEQEYLESSVSFVSLALHLVRSPGAAHWPLPKSMRPENCGNFSFAQKAEAVHLPSCSHAEILVLRSASEHAVA